MPIQTLDQKRAEKALAINMVLKNNRDKDSARLYKKLPGLIVSSGLAPALAFVDTKDKASRLIVKNLIGDEGIPSILRDKNTLMNKTVEVLALLQWINRFNDATPALKEK
jgi:CRISPR/Cas system CMR-associated protein Cmr5 small subunit